MYLKKTENYILDYLKSQYKNDDLNEMQKSGMLIQKSPEGIDSDFGTSIPLRLSKILNKNPMDIANHLSSELDKSKPEFISKIEPLTPGYINFTLSKKTISETLVAQSMGVEGIPNFFHSTSMD